MPRAQFAEHALEAEPPCLEQHEHMVEEVGDLADHLSVSAARAGQCNLKTGAGMMESRKVEFPGASGAGEPHHIELATTLVVRESTGPPPRVR